LICHQQSCKNFFIKRDSLFKDKNERCKINKEYILKTYNLKDWDDYRPTIQKIVERYGRLRITEDDSKKNIVLFRGHSNAQWQLDTTLERSTNNVFSIVDYIRYAARCSVELESLTGKNWNIPPFPDLEKKIFEKQESMKPYLPCYNYLVYLRHHGFPSPLLDWTSSPYIAAYFAFIDASIYKRVAVNVYIERPRGIKNFRGGSPQIKLMGPYVKTDVRHFAQKAWYTIATQYKYKEKQHFFCNHINVFSESKSEQDVLIKITMPASDRLKALTELSEYNIDHFTLFQTEDSLVKALAVKELELENK
jgi:hypothetical protein